MLILTILMAAIAVLFAIIGVIWMRGGGIKIMWMSEERQAKIDQKTYLHFNGMVILVTAGICAISALFTHFGFSWGYLPGFFALLVFVGATVWSSISKSFRIKDEDGKALTDKPAKRKKALILIGIFVLVTMLPAGWLFFEGTRPIRANFSDNSLSFAGLYGITVQFSEIAEVHLYQYSMEDIGTGIRRMGHGTPNNLRGRFAAGHLIVQSPDQGPTIRISRRTAGPLYISLSTPEATQNLYENIRGNLQ
ncbi:MAG: DUF3784 domain-containing protein [Defluviitaleaceae bacterium]|nr:DUF3784 domain-containing protein [Defluviitaleaceae bacterium]